MLSYNRYYYCSPYTIIIYFNKIEKYLQREYNKSTCFKSSEMQRPNIYYLASYPDVYSGNTCNDKNSNFYYNRTVLYNQKTARSIAEEYGIDPDEEYNRLDLECPEIARGYREKFVCFECRHYSKTQNASIRRENVHGYQTNYEIKMATDKNITCPKCHHEKVYVGPKFAPPKQDDIKAWNDAKEKYEKDSRVYCYSYNEFADRVGGHPRKKNKEII
ncbi:hypothetical protein Klosneuvirus_1_279 [Klosneuvirus KNV1]|uniref:Uncharacterized protein n=1 Tax=Klosneuvirus KNV1 TaxID=1977640 RepID=A0A1V0SI76_9VIRU|nr:hypothetical protein Klosneuvirus_1_279 [Klosneuvirus KNV1]